MSETVVRVGPKAYLVVQKDRDLWAVMSLSDMGNHWVHRGESGSIYFGCDCGDFIFRRDGIDPLGCRHVRAARKVVGFPDVWQRSEEPAEIL